MLCLESKLLGAAASPSPTAPSLEHLVRYTQHLGQPGLPRGVRAGCRAAGNRGHWHGSTTGSASAGAGIDAGNLSNAASARPPPSLSSRGRVLILHTDSRAPTAAPEAYWAVTAAANALYAHMHGNGPC